MELNFKLIDINKAERFFYEIKVYAKFGSLSNFMYSRN